MGRGRQLQQPVQPAVAVQRVMVQLQLRDQLPRHQLRPQPRQLVAAQVQALQRGRGHQLARQLGQLRVAADDEAAEVREAGQCGGGEAAEARHAAQLEAGDGGGHQGEAGGAQAGQVQLAQGHRGQGGQGREAGGGQGQVVAGDVQLGQPGAALAPGPGQPGTHHHLHCDSRGERREPHLVRLLWERSRLRRLGRAASWHRSQLPSWLPPSTSCCSWGDPASRR